MRTEHEDRGHGPGEENLVRTMARTALRNDDAEAAQLAVVAAQAGPTLPG